MPELAEVYFFSKSWRPAIGSPIVDIYQNPQSRVFREIPAFNPDKLRKQSLNRVLTHGKKIACVFESGISLGIHLGMTGKLFSAAPKHRPQKHDALVLYTQSSAFGFNDPRQFGKVNYAQTLDELWPPENLSPELQSAAFTQVHLAAILQRHPRSKLKPLLLNQSYFPGVGNWMADEILWQAQLLPKRTPSSLNRNEIERLWKSARFVATESMNTIGVDYRDPPPEWLFLHRWKKGGICPKTNNALVYEKIGGRTTCYSPNWQS